MLAFGRASTLRIALENAPQVLNLLLHVQTVMVLQNTPLTSMPAPLATVAESGLQSSSRLHGSTESESPRRPFFFAQKIAHQASHSTRQTRHDLSKRKNVAMLPLFMVMQGQALSCRHLQGFPPFIVYLKNITVAMLLSPLLTSSRCCWPSPYTT